MYHIAESVEIRSTPDRVFALLKDAEARMRLNPGCAVIACEQLNDRGAGEACFRFFLQANGKRFKYDVVEFAERDRIISRAVDGTACVTLSVKPTSAGTRLLHEEDFVLPDEVLEPQSPNADAQSFRLFRQVLRMFYGLDYYEARKARKADEIIASMKPALQTWLLRIRDMIETKTADRQNDTDCNKVWKKAASGSC